MSAMEERYEEDKADEVLLPGFRFHPTDEELIGFYLKRKVQQKPLAIELIRQLDIYKFDPWDLPSLAPTTGEKEWYFYCPRDRKYKNSSRPNRVTAAGFWKATGTDRPIYSSEGTRCIGLKKSLVFYRGRAAKGSKTDWMMHEFRLPSYSGSTKASPFDKNIHPNDSWAICRIFKKTASMAQRELNHSMAHFNKNSNTFAPPPNAPLQETKNTGFYPVLDFTSHGPSMHLKFSSTVLGDVKRASPSIDFGQLQQAVKNSGNEEEEEEESAAMVKSTLYVTNDHLAATPEAVVDFPFNLWWESSSSSMSWMENKCYSTLDDLIQ